MHLPPEFQLVAACCRWPPSPERDEAVRAAAASVDWPLVLRIAERHRVEGLVWNALLRSQAPVPAEAAGHLQAAAARIARQNLVLTGESLRLSGLLEQAGVRHLFVKGVTLGVLAYGSIGPKMGWDIDL
ncbi:MAG TPA: nucleotidyltransferase family protein, partial [Allosphingosinicella sp.]